jgi:hypothetical protein
MSEFVNRRAESDCIPSDGAGERNIAFGFARYCYKIHNR